MKLSMSVLEKSNWTKYKKAGGTNLTRCPKNVIQFSSSETIAHALCKSIAGITLRKYGEIYFDSEIINCVKMIESAIKSQQYMVNPVTFLTEAVPLKDTKRRVDLVRLDTNEKIEFECSHKIDKSKFETGVKTIYI